MQSGATPLSPRKGALDAVSPRNPVILTRKDGHSIWLNSVALRNAHITRETVAPDGGVIDHDVAGEPSGIFRENAMELLGSSVGAFAADIRQDTLLPRDSTRARNRNNHSSQHRGRQCSTTPFKSCGLGIN